MIRPLLLLRRATTTPPCAPLPSSSRLFAFAPRLLLPARVLLLLLLLLQLLPLLEVPGGRLHVHLLKRGLGMTGEHVATQVSVRRHGRPAAVAKGAVILHQQMLLVLLVLLVAPWMLILVLVMLRRVRPRMVHVVRVLEWRRGVYGRTIPARIHAWREHAAARIHHHVVRRVRRRRHCGQAA